MTPHPAARAIVLIPAHNEAACLPSVIGEIREVRPDVDVLVIDDGSTDDTQAVVQQLRVRWVRLYQQLGVGAAMRTGLQRAAQLGYTAVVRMDGDGQHRASDIDRILSPLLAGQADAVVGSRYAARGVGSTGLSRWLPQRLLSTCLSLIARQRLTDPTSGFCAFGAAAIALLRRHHPTGYPEPELLLLLCRNGLRVREIAIEARARVAGQTTLTLTRSVVAMARILLALIVVPWQAPVEVPARD